MFCSMLKWVKEKERRQAGKKMGERGREKNDKVTEIHKMMKYSKANKVSVL